MSVDRDQWNSFVQKNPRGHVLQSWQWGEFKKEKGQKTWRVGLENGQGLIATALIVRQRLPGGRNYLYIPRGPVISSDADRKEALTKLLEKIRPIAREEKSILPSSEPVCSIFFNLIVQRLKLIESVVAKPIDKLRPKKINNIFFISSSRFQIYGHPITDSVCPGADDGARTRGHWLGKPALYQLSYVRKNY